MCEKKKKSQNIIYNVKKNDLFFKCFKIEEHETKKRRGSL